MPRKEKQKLKLMAVLDILRRQTDEKHPVGVPEILQLLQDAARKDGMTVIIITHNSALTAMADRVIHIKNGTVQSMERNKRPTPVEEIEW